MVGNTITCKIITTKLTNRANPQNMTSDEQYFRVTIFLPFLDNFISKVNDRFLNHKNVLRGMLKILQHSVNNYNNFLVSKCNLFFLFII